MQVENSFSVEASVEQVWSYLLDVQRVAPCVPGAELTEVVSDTEYKGTVKVKLGAVQVSYRGTLVLTEVDSDAHRVVLSATGSETRGSGGASGTVTSTVVSDGPNRCTVNMTSEIAVTGKVAQFGRNIMQDVSNRLIKEFAKCLESNLNADNEPERGPAGSASSSSYVESTASSGSNAKTQVESAAAGTEATVTRVSNVDSPAGPTPGAESSTSRHTAAAAEIKVLPLVVDVTRSRVAKGLRRFAHLLDPDKSSE